MLDAQLRTWAADPNIACVVLHGAGEKAFCAGGDVRSLYHAMQGLSGRACQPRCRHILQRGISPRLPAPPLFRNLCWFGAAGIVLGGGLGLMAGASHRGRDGNLARRHAGDHHRFVSRCGRQLVSTTHAAPSRVVPGADGRTYQRARCARRWIGGSFPALGRSRGCVLAAQPSLMWTANVESRSASALRSAARAVALPRSHCCQFQISSDMRRRSRRSVAAARSIRSSRAS